MVIVAVDRQITAQEWEVVAVFRILTFVIVHVGVSEILQKSNKLGQVDNSGDGIKF